MFVLLASWGTSKGTWFYFIFCIVYSLALVTYYYNLHSAGYKHWGHLLFPFSSLLNILNTASYTLQVLTKDDPPRKTYIYKLNVPVAAQWISLAVAPFEILPDHQFNLISHICLSANMSKLRNTMEFFHSAFRFSSLSCDYCWSKFILVFFSSFIIS